MPHDSPRISVNKLGEYLTADAGRRKTILRQQKKPSRYMTTHYDAASRSITAFYNGERNPSFIKRQIDRLSKRVPKHDHDAQRLNDCMDALEAFLDVLDTLALPEYDIRVGAIRPPKLYVAQVAVSVRPELLLYREDGLVGAVKFQFSKSHALDEKSANYVGTAVHQYVEDILHVDRAKPQNVIVADLLSRNVYRGPKAVVQRRKDIVAACEEIYVRWSSIE